MNIKLGETVFQILITAVTLVIVFEFNIHAFNYDWLTFINGINLIWLPAFVKVMAVLIFGWRGAAGLGLGCMYMMYNIYDTVPIEMMIIHVASWSILPWVAIQLGLRWFELPDTLAGIRSWHILWIAGIEAVIHGIVKTYIYWRDSPDTYIGSTFIGLTVSEVFGTIILVYCGSLMLRVWQYKVRLDRNR